MVGHRYHFKSPTSLDAEIYKDGSFKIKVSSMMGKSPFGCVLLHSRDQSAPQPLIQ